MAEPTQAQILKKMKTIPSELSFEDDNGNLLEDWGKLEIDTSLKMALAYQMLKQKQSLSTVIVRILSNHLKKVKNE